MGDNKAINIKIKQQIMPFLCHLPPPLIQDKRICIQLLASLHACLPAILDVMWCGVLSCIEEWALTKSVFLVSFLDFHLPPTHSQQQQQGQPAAAPQPELTDVHGYLSVVILLFLCVWRWPLPPPLLVRPFITPGTIDDRTTVLEIGRPW